MPSGSTGILQSTASETSTDRLVSRHRPSSRAVCVHDVAEVGDLVPVDPYLGRDHTAAMERRAEFRGRVRIS